jgi:hypothetical protein
VGRKCLCNGLLATVGLGQQREAMAEPPIVTCGSAAPRPPAAGAFSTADVLGRLLENV